MLAASLTFRRIMMVLILALAVSSLLKSQYCVYTPPLRNAVSLALMPIARPLNSVTSYVRSETDRPVLGDLQQLSDELRYKDALVLSLQKQVRELERVNAELQGLAQRIGGDYVFREARVIGRTSDPSAGTLTIDRGARHGLRPGLAVVKGASLVGRLIEVGPSTSVIGLITRPDNLIEVVLAPPRLPEGGLPADRQSVVQLRVSDPHQFVADDVNREVPVEAGDYARLEDHRGPESWPLAVQGMIVGQVQSVEPNPDQTLLQRITVQPMLSLRRLDTITVVVPRLGGGGEGGS